MAKTSGKITFMSRVIVTVLKSGATPITDAEAALAVLETEQAMNNLVIPQVAEGNITLQPYVRVHIMEEVDRQGTFKRDKKGEEDNGDNKDKDLA